MLFKLAMERDIRSAHAMLRLIIDSVPQLIAWKDCSSVYLGCNKNFAELMGLPSPEALIGRNNLDLYGQGREKNLLMDGDRRIIETGHPEYHISEQVLKPDGQKIWLDTSKIPLKDENGQVIGLLLTAEDITERVKSQKHMTLLNKQLAKESRQRRVLSEKLMDLIEKDRREMARELHDHVGQIATTLKTDVEKAMLHAQNLQCSLSPQLQDIFIKATFLIKTVSETARGFRSSLLDDLGLIPSLSSLFQMIEKSSGLKINFFSKDVPARFERDKELALYRIAQEALNNILKHARAGQVHVNLFTREGTIFLTVEDDGQGFDPKKFKQSPERQGSLGLILMKERAGKFRGRLHLDSSPGRGTHLQAEIPMVVDNEAS
ncbi:MAG: PAS domain-containing protein [Deltaproteobacteria bacterium]|nr:PAS domain-containing protein [Deltaproteobacteria bacterium]